MFFALLLGLWYKVIEGIPLGEQLVHKNLIHYPDTHIILGVPLVMLFIVLLILGLLAWFEGRIYLWDVNLVYSRAFSKLEELMADIESLNKNISFMNNDKK